jgi:plasmid stabilization system protein ParE
MGHAKVSTTLDIYTHLMQDENPDAARKLGRAVFGKVSRSSELLVNSETPKTLKA